MTINRALAKYTTSFRMKHRTELRKKNYEVINKISGIHFMTISRTRALKNKIDLFQIFKLSRMFFVCLC